MHICYLADARSPIAQNWISYFVQHREHEVTVISSYPCASTAIPGARLIEFPFALSSFAPASQNGNGTNGNDFFGRALAQFRSRRVLETSLQIRSWIAPFDVGQKARAMAALIDSLRPDLVHAMRLPFEGFLAAASVKTAPLLISIWGNDFTLFSDRNRRMSAFTDKALLRADGLHCDCKRDLRAAFSRGFSQNKPWRVLPGNGGLDTAKYFNTRPDPQVLRRFQIPTGVPLVLNPRGFRAYVRNDTFFRAIPLVLRDVPQAFFIATGMVDNPVAKRWIRHRHVRNSVRLLPSVSRDELATLFAASQVSVSPSSHDGTPNTLLEAMACGCFPVVGEVESMREWIVNGENGLICGEGDATSLASCIVKALREPELRIEAAEINRCLVRTRAEYAAGMAEAKKLYSEVVNTSAGKSAVFSTVSP